MAIITLGVLRRAGDVLGIRDAILNEIRQKFHEQIKT